MIGAEVDAYFRFPSAENTVGTKEEEIELAEPTSGTCWQIHGIQCVLTCASLGDCP